MRGLLREPLLHFVLAGGLLFATYFWLNDGEDSEPRVVHISAAQVDWLRKTWTRQWSRPPDERELSGLVSGYLKEQLLAREARELGLDLDDTVVRRRLAQKMEFLVQDAALLADPNEAELLSLYDSHRAEFISPARVSFTQIFFKTSSGAFEGLEQLKVSDPADVGDSSLLARDYVLTDAKTITSVFGPGFSTDVFALDIGRWHGPLASSYGFHLVRVSEQQAARQRPFEEVREQVFEIWQRLQQEQARVQYFAGLLEKYDVVVDEDVAPLLGPITEGVR